MIHLAPYIIAASAGALALASLANDLRRIVTIAPVLRANAERFLP
ncbi:hypothetical protein [Novosphingobium sp.]|nr:hypothetical protein [Novosphingobium sp.]